LSGELRCFELASDFSVILACQLLDIGLLVVALLQNDGAHYFFNIIVFEMNLNTETTMRR